MKSGVWLGIGMMGMALLNGCGPAPDEKATSAASAATPLAAPAPGVTPVDWKTYSDDDLHFSFESPIELEVNKPPKGLSNKMVEFQGNDARREIYIHANVVDIGKLELDLTAEFDRQVSTLKSMDQALRNLQVATNPVTLSDAAGFLAEGTASLPGRVPYGVKMLKIRKGAILMDMLIQYSRTGEFQAQAERILNSIAINN